MPAERWLEMTGLILVALIPFAILGIALGHLLTIDSMGPALGGITALFAFLGGTWFPITGSGWLAEVARWIPSYWLVQAGQIGVGGEAWGGRGWLVIGLWSAVLAVVAAAGLPARHQAGVRPRADTPRGGLPEDGSTLIRHGRVRSAVGPRPAGRRPPLRRRARASAGRAAGAPSSSPPSGWSTSPRRRAASPTTRAGRPPWPATPASRSSRPATSSPSR